MWRDRRRSIAIATQPKEPVNGSEDRPRQLREVFLSHGWIIEADFPHTPRMQHCDAQVPAAARTRARSS